MYANKITKITKLYNQDIVINDDCYYFVKKHQVSIMSIANPQERLRYIEELFSLKTEGIYKLHIIKLIDNNWWKKVKKPTDDDIVNSQVDDSGIQLIAIFTSLDPYISRH